jgi:hypothetical protein
MQLHSRQDHVKSTLLGSRVKLQTEEGGISADCAISKQICQIL